MPKLNKPFFLLDNCFIGQEIDTTESDLDENLD